MNWHVEGGKIIDTLPTNSTSDWYEYIRPGGILGQHMNTNLTTKNENDKFVVTAEVQGVKDENLSITITGTILYITGKQEHTQKSVVHSLSLSRDLDLDNVDAVLVNGVLTLTFTRKVDTIPTKTIKLKK